MYRVAELLDYTSDEMTGRNMYSLIHGQDVFQLRKCHLDCEYFRQLVELSLILTLIIVFSIAQRSSHVKVLQNNQQEWWIYLGTNMCHFDL